MRIVEHIKKNLTLFESNRETYEITSPNYANRGHLQTLLSRRQSKDFPVRPTAPKPYSRFTDQYTQYRASDLTASDAREGDSNQQVRGLVDQIVREPANKRTIVSTLPNKNTTGHKQQSEQRKRTSSLKRNVSSLNELLIKRPIEFVKQKAGVHQAQQAESEGGREDRVRAQSQPNIQTKYKIPFVDLAKSNNEEEERYKVPVKQIYSTSSNIYLLPTFDEKVHIATRVVKDIILAHQAAQHKAAVAQSYHQNNSTANRLIDLFKTYSFRKPELNLLQESLDKTKNRPNFKRPKSLRLSLKKTAIDTGSASTLSSRSDRARRRQAQSGTSRADYYREPTLDHSVSKIRAKVKMPSGKSDKATIVDNKDGTVKISYEPKEVGAHEISLKYNDEPIDEGPIIFYVDAVGSAKKKITAYGSGLTRGQAGETNKFTINTGGLGSAKLNVTLDGPSKTSVDLSDNKDGTISVSYSPPTPGEYKIKISFDGKQVVGSPFTTTIGDEGRQRSQISVGRGSEHTLDLKINQDDLIALQAVIVTPCGLEEPCGLKLLKSSQLAIIFTPREQGEHSVSVKRRGNHISGSPFKFDVLSRDIGDAKQVKVSGKGLREGKANADNEILINTKEAGFGGLSVALEGPGGSEICNKDVVDGTIKLSYKPYEPGQYNLSVKYADHVVPGSPFCIKVSGQGSNPQKEVLKKFRKLVPIEDVNTECHFSFKMPGVSAYDLSAKIHSPQGNADDCSVKDKGDFVYQVSFVPKEVGLYSLSIKFKDIHIAGSPFPFTVGPLLDFGPHKVRCGGPGLIKGPCNKLNEFNVYTREAGAGELSVMVEGPSKAELSFTDRKDGSCHVGYKASQPGDYRISVFFNDIEVPESPFRAIVLAQSGDIAKIELGPMPPENMIQLEKPCNLPIIMNGAKGNIEAKVRLPCGKLEDCFASPIDAENWGVRFIPREYGVHHVHIKCKGAHIPQSPVQIRVGHDKADPAAILVHGQGLKGATVNHATDFVIETCNAGHALMEINIEGPSKVSMGCAELDEGYKVNYTPLAAGEYLISIKYNGSHIGSSPFKVRAVKQPGSKTVADVGSHEISTIAITTTDREAKQKVDQMPKFKSDASRVYCKGMGLKKAFAGKPNTLTVNCSEAGFNMIFASFLGPTRNTIHECSVKHMGGSIYEVKYTCKDKGDAILMVKYGDEQIPGSPFRLECV